MNAAPDAPKMLGAPSFTQFYRGKGWESKNLNRDLVHEEMPAQFGKELVCVDL
jgi:hypothetical protein